MCIRMTAAENNESKGLEVDHPKSRASIFWGRGRLNSQLGRAHCVQASKWMKACNTRHGWVQVFCQGSEVSAKLPAS